MTMKRYDGDITSGALQRADQQGKNSWLPQPESANAATYCPPGAKFDDDKPRIGLVLSDFPRALEAIAKVGAFGARKYTDHNWLAVADGPARYTDAMWRHWLAAQRGEESDKQSGLPHVAHMAWNALAVLELTLRAWEVQV